MENINMIWNDLIRSPKMKKNSDGKVASIIAKRALEGFEKEAKKRLYAK